MKNLKARMQQFSRAKRLYILPTMNGVKLFFLCLVLLFTGLIYANNFILFFNFLLFSLFICSMFYTHFNLGQIQVEKIGLESSFAGHLGNLKVIVQNNSQFPRYHLHLRFFSDDSYQVQEMLIPKIEAGEVLEVVGPVNLIKRGAHDIKRVEVYTIFPFSFFRTFTYFDLNYRFYIYPKPMLFAYDVSLIETTKLDPDDDSLNLKPFRDGDSYRHVHWKKFALDESLVVKEIEDNQGQELFVEGDQLVGGFKPEDQLSYLSFMVNELSSLGRNFGLRYRDYLFEPSGEREQTVKILEKLAVVEFK